MTTFIALYRGDKIDTAQLVAVSSDTDLVISVAEHIIDRNSQIQHADPVLSVLHMRRIAALRIITQSLLATSGLPEQNNVEGMI